MKSRSEAPARRRDDLLDAARQIVLEKGLAGLTVDEVAVRAEVAKGTFYLYFRSKEQVLGALRQRFVDDLIARQRAELDDLPADDWAGRLARWMELAIRGYVAHAGLHDALFLHTSAADQYRRGHVADPATHQHAAALAEILDSGKAAGDFVIDDPRAATVLLYNAMHGTADYLVERCGHREPGGPDVDAVIAESRNLCLRYVRHTAN